ncbi:transposase [Mesorhizobium sp. M0761]
MNGAIFEHYIETQLAPQLSPGDIVILDNVGFHKNERAAQLVRRGRLAPVPAAILTRSQSDRDGLLKTQGAAEKESGQNLDELCQALGDICHLLEPVECRNFFKAAGYEAN